MCSVVSGTRQMAQSALSRTQILCRPAFVMLCLRRKRVMVVSFRPGWMRYLILQLTSGWRTRQPLLFLRASTCVTSSDLRFVGRSASDVRVMDSRCCFEWYLRYVGNVDGVEDLLDFRVERFHVRLVRGVDVLPAVLHDARRRVISVARDLHSVV